VSALNLVLPLLTSLLSFGFAALLLDQWRQRRRAFQLVWGTGLLWYGISSGTEFLGWFGWNSSLYRAWYLFGALFVAAYLGAGTIFLLSKTGFGYFAGLSIAVGGLFAPLSQLRLIQEGHPTAWSVVWLVVGLSAATGLAVIYATARHRSHAPAVAMSALSGASVLAAYLVATAWVAPPGYALDPVTHVPVGTAMPGYLRVMTGPFNVAGAFCLVFGALYSMVEALRLRRFSSRVPATLLIAIGGFVPSITSGLDRFGVTWSLYLGQFVGVLLIFVGFLISEEVFQSARAWFMWHRTVPNRPS
jgi:hypothetical protein